MGLELSKIRKLQVFETRKLKLEGILFSSSQRVNWRKQDVTLITTLASKKQSRMKVVNLVVYVHEDEHEHHYHVR